ncbi:Conserved_hypothetical protein [Hexamita inflata]|uniref:Uncharacterized protein n=1 Tax=Hexamita inflata TaxID=28002 RepID=A0AA86UG22_9EUKA|nr:Conserved hypothetical protein [Hexamita inflata]CAI9928411.1 Conserved hypothetical protein [Hexamita inflata]CAI9933460.1 Conserved hypothetical protein [Hexamita inflata]CAI9954399.1 Conserved hypothetical protein [Hexamita inflata]CAI9954402.1 Conserved hypothetical protein [Hexamita inflata]
MWKTLFDDALFQYLASNTGTTPTSSQHMYQLVQQQYRTRGIWLQIAQQLNITQTQAHDYFHNTWVKQFYAPFDPYKQQIRDIVALLSKTTRDRFELSLKVLEVFELAHPHERFHAKSVQQFIHQTYQKQANASQESCRENAVHVRAKEESASGDISKYIVFG